MAPMPGRPESVVNDRNVKFVWESDECQMRRKWHQLTFQKNFDISHYTEQFMFFIVYSRWVLHHLTKAENANKIYHVVSGSRDASK
ncbi:hypothetical protein TNCV_3319271 [Trichonephila clavipes]|nr:hypothetical protein TNCV_3319271 [Trichonephila clavipes]